MTTIAERDRPKVRDLLARELVHDVELLLFTRGRSLTGSMAEVDGGTDAETRELLEELAGLSDRLHLCAHDVAEAPDTATQYNVAAVPTVIVRRRPGTHAPGPDRPGAHADPVRNAQGAGAGTSWQHLQRLSVGNVRFVGLPGGYEFSTLLAVIVDVSTGRTDLSTSSLEALTAIDTPVQIRVFVTPSCPYCPRVARLAHQLAMANPMIVAEVIEANEFPELSERYRVRSVPKTVINDRIEFVGSLPEAKVIEAIQTAVSQPVVGPNA